ncbi:hypothetical protein Cgig2_013220 [Carnegiea gigantea]|uniref:Uncharacterized protein n=1 Tax=Carnegiea gigantea TaxID=171969 RepID=A0A9Q1KQ73_9CARY|nr:hypothetical protein Cgig2_013220 [Carnegiea gigantea]
MDEELQISLGNEFAPEEWRAVYRWWKVAYISECLLVMVMMWQFAEKKLEEEDATSQYHDKHEAKGVLEGDIKEVEAIDVDSGGEARNASQLWTVAAAFVGHCEVIRDQWNVGGVDVAKEEESSHAKGLVKGSVMDEELQISLGNEFAPEEWRAVYLANDESDEKKLEEEEATSQYHDVGDKCSDANAH